MPTSAKMAANGPETRRGAEVDVFTASPEDLVAVARTRARCYDATYAAETSHRDRLIEWNGGEGGLGGGRGRLEEGDVLLARRPGREGLVGTATSLRGQMCVRGVPLSCQGVAWVGTTQDARRSGGVASALMARTIDLARERGEILSSLMPFRASFYEHFGYGLVERRAMWEIPTSILPQSREDPGFLLLETDDRPRFEAVTACRDRQWRSNHGDMSFPRYDHFGGFETVLRQAMKNGYVFARGGERVTAFVTTQAVTVRERRGLLCQFVAYDTPEDFLSVLRFLGTQKDQYGFIQFAAPVDLPVNFLLRESQLPHRPVEHPHARCDIAARMQVRILDHVRFFNETGWPDPTARGRVVVEIAECDGPPVRLRFDIADGRCEAKTTTDDPAFTTADRTWAPIALGEFPASTAARLGLAACSDSSILPLLDTLSHGPLPFCREFF